MTLQAQVLDHLRQLVAFDTQNPPRNATEDGIFQYLSGSLHGFEHALRNDGDGRISLLAVRGKPNLLFNFHIDTVPASPAWHNDPWQLVVDGDRVTGLGACDIKGAAAAMLVAANSAAGDVALLFTSDEEAGNSHCVRTFLDSAHGYTRVIVAEPTTAQAVTAHRGIVTGTVAFTGKAGHASAQRGVGHSAVHQAIAWGQLALDWSASQDQRRFANLQGLRFNIGVIEGGIKPNMIAPSATVKFGLRSLPGMDQTALIGELHEITARFEGASLTPGFVAPALNSTVGELARSVALPEGSAVDFWTEAALFAQAGLDTIVFGPGDIAQAHTADEWVSLQQLVCVAEHYQRIIADGTA